MATAPTPFFPTTVVPPPPCGCGAPPYAPCSFPPAAAYPSPPFPGGYYTSPFPFFYNNPPSLPYAATYPYTHPASMYTPTFPSPAGFSPNWPPPAPDPIPYTNTSSPPNFPLTSDLPPAGFDHHPAPAAPDTATTTPNRDHRPIQSHTSSKTSSSPAHHTSSPPKEAGEYPARASRPHAAVRTPRRRRSRSAMRSATTLPHHPDEDLAPLRATSLHQDHLVHGDGLAPACAAPLLPDRQDGHGPLQFVQEGPNHGDQASANSERQATDSTSAPRLPPLVGLLADVFERTPEVTFSAPSRSSNTCAAANSPEIPLGSRFGKSFDVPTLACPVSATSAPTLQSATADTALQLFDEMPQQYDFQNLNRKSLLLADGTERSYYALPDNYALERVVPESVFAVDDDNPDGCSNEFVQWLTSTPEQRSYAEEQQDIEHILKCVSRAPETEQTLACMNYLTDMQQQHKFQKASVHVQQLSDPQLKEWDSGASLPLVSRKTQHSALALQRATALAGSEVTRFPGCKGLPFWIPNNIYVSWETGNGMSTYFFWDPGILSLIYMTLGKYTVAHQVRFVQQTAELSFPNLTDCMQYIASNGINPVLHASVLVMQRDARLSQGLASWPHQPVSSALCIWDPGIGISSSMYHWLPSLSAATEKPLSSLQTPDQATWLSLVNNASYAWDPGTILIQNKSILLLLFTEAKEMVTLIIDNWEFLSEQSVKKNYTAKNLLSLHNYL